MKLIQIIYTFIDKVIDVITDVIIGVITSPIIVVLFIKATIKYLVIPFFKK